MDKMVFSVKEVSKLLGIGINQTYALVKKNDFPAVKIGQQYLVPKKQLEEWLEKKSQDKWF